MLRKLSSLLLRPSNQVLIGVVLGLLLHHLFSAALDEFLDAVSSSLSGKIVFPLLIAVLLLLWKLAINNSSLKKRIRELEIVEDKLAEAKTSLSMWSNSQVSVIPKEFAKGLLDRVSRLENPPTLYDRLNPKKRNE